GAGHRAHAGLPLPRRAGRGGRPGPDRGVLLHPRRARQGAGPADRRRHERPGGRRDRLDHPQPPLLPPGRSGPARGRAPAPPLWGWLAARAAGPALPGPAPPPADGARHRAVVVGYGPVGRTVTRLLRENGIDPTVVELNLETVRRLRAEGVAAVYG